MLPILGAQQSVRRILEDEQTFKTVRTLTLTLTLTRSLTLSLTLTLTLTLTPTS